MVIRPISFVVSAIAVLLLASPTFGVGLTRTTTLTTGGTSGWILGVDFDSDSDTGTFSTSSQAVAYDPNDPFIPMARSTAAMNALATAANVTPVARLAGSTYTDSYLGGGYTDGAGNWYPGTTQTFNGSVETDNTVTSAGTLNHFVSFSLQTGANTQEGFFSGWARVGNVQVYFTWHGGNKVQVSEYIDGALDNTSEIINNYGDFTYDVPFSEDVSVGDLIEVDVYGFFIDDNNPQAATRTVTLQGGTY